MKRTIALAASVLFILTAGSMLQPARALARPVVAVAPAYYLALGDALSLGPVSSTASGHRACVAAGGRTGFVCPLWKRLQRSTPGLLEANLALAAAPAEDSCSFRSITSCACARCSTAGPSDQPVRENLLAGDTPGYDPLQTSQLAAAERFIDAHPGRVKVISLEIGGADLQELAAAEPMSPAAEEAWIGRLDYNYAAIVTTLHQAAPDARLILIDAIDPFAPLTRSLDPSVRAIALHLAPFYASFARVVTVEARSAGAIHASVWQAFHGAPARGLWQANGSGSLTSTGYRLYAATVVHAYATYRQTHIVFLPRTQPAPVRPQA